MRIETNFAGERAEIETIAAACIENHVFSRRRDHLRNSAQQRRGDPEIVQTPPPGDRVGSIARLLRTAILRLKEIDVSAARDVERVTARADQPLSILREDQVAFANGTE